MLAALERATRSINRLFVALASALALLITAVILYDVALRTVATPPIWAHDLARYALLYLFFLALGPALESGHHVVVDMFDRVVPAALRPYQAHAAALLTLAFGAVLLWATWRMMGQAFADNRLAPAVVPIPLKWIYVIGPIGTIQFMLVAVAQLGRASAARTQTGG